MCLVDGLLSISEREALCVAQVCIIVVVVVVRAGCLIIVVVALLSLFLFTL